jgi:hypothetical protein
VTKYNFLEWQVGIRAYLQPGKHLCVIKAGVDANSMATAPVAPADPDLQEKWESSEEIAMGIIMATASKMHLELEGWTCLGLVVCYQTLSYIL